jgi:hypothetical protein
MMGIFCIVLLICLAYRDVSGFLTVLSHGTMEKCYKSFKNKIRLMNVISQVLKNGFMISSDRR